MTEQTTFAPERLRAFVDAVVAIAMTLLILPLLESVSDAATDGTATGAFLVEHRGQIVSFVLSFVLIALFWMEHHRQYERVLRVSNPLLYINVAWMLTIVWLPVPTAMLGQMDTDPLQAVLYIGTLILTQATTLAGKLYLMRHPELIDLTPERLRRGAIGDIAAIILFCVALPIAAWVHVVGYFALLLLAFSTPVEKLLDRLRR
ncbi:TMEM175 family protein [Microbacterium sp.]|uniref:TMEM175 family protein n=1 Tax=Microbacterium sp. TaxID=51671 RepID=UPI0027322C21|nr:TMEM175 family protein [Microbacterium sp.]MDP3952358.1 TMEM175 family protein [Microbacterium sp.]